ncbi:hypothetical protein JTB14_038438 [Gonioctena quinquepunctata]|nr:hypothetical protein JTB14_038438 [Gonioctena quinquepunctata]
MTDRKSGAAISRERWENTDSGYKMCEWHDAVKLNQPEEMKIGWTEWRVIERRIGIKCCGCWHNGCYGAHCKGPDRNKLCLKCGKDRHKAAACTNESYCVHKLLLSMEATKEVNRRATDGLPEAQVEQSSWTRVHVSRNDEISNG